MARKLKLKFTLSPTLKSSTDFNVEFSLENPGLGILGILETSSFERVEFSRENPGFGIFDMAPGSVPMPELEEVEAAEVGRGR